MTVDARRDLSVPAPDEPRTSRAAVEPASAARARPPSDGASDRRSPRRRRGPRAATQARVKPGDRLEPPLLPELGGVRPSILLLEDSVDYAELVERMLRSVWRGRFELAMAGSIAEADECIMSAAPNCILLDLSLPDAQGLEAVAWARERAPEAAIVVLTGRDDARVAVQAVHEGAQDFLYKGKVDAYLLARSVTYAMDRKTAELRLAHQALHDELTGLPNRVLLMDRLHLALSRLERAPGRIAVLFVDLRRFKGVNDSFGHATGDLLLQHAATQMQRAVRPTDTVARIGGDEFVVVLEGLESDDEAVRVCRRIIASLATPIVLCGYEYSSGSDVGISITADHRASPEMLMRAADAAMYRAKRSGDGWARLDGEPDAAPGRRLQFEDELRRAIRDGGLHLLYQPQIELATGRLFGVEALVRWQHPREGLICAQDFVPLAEELNLINELDQRVLHEALHQLAAWQQAREPDEVPLVSINVSAREIARGGFVKRLVQAIDDVAVDPRGLCLEITERTLAQDTASLVAKLSAVKELGVSLAVDDFGSGYSSLATLHRFPIDIVKIDGAFIAELDGADGGGRRLLAAVISVVQGLGLIAVTEGVERVAQLEVVRELGCDAAQGYLVGRPQQPVELERRLSRA